MDIEQSQSIAKSQLAAIYTGWQNYQDLLIQALTPLSEEQCALRAAPGLRTIGENAAHIIGTRAGWFHSLLHEGGAAFAEMSAWDEPGVPAQELAELLRGVQATWEGMQAAIARWSPEDWQQTFPNDGPDYPNPFTRQWVLWHLLEHDLHHGGEISLTLGMHGLEAPNL